MPSPARLLLSSGHSGAAAPPPPSVALHADTFLILAAVLCFLLCVVGLALVARCSRLCNPSAFSAPGSPAAAAAAALPPCKGLKRKALQSLPTASFAAEEEEERPECAICLAEFADGDEIRVLPPCGHGFHAACVDLWLLSRSTCPSCRRVLVVPAPPPPPFLCPGCGGAAASAQSPAAPEPGAAGDRGGCRAPLP